MKPGLACATLALGACLGPQVSDDIGQPQLILPAGTQLPSIYDDAEVKERIENAIGLPDAVPLISSFAGGAPTGYWNFGPAPDHAIPIYVLTRKNASGAQIPIGQPDIVDILPGDSFYSPYWIVFATEVTGTYADQVIPSLDALREAVREGLVLAPVRTSFAFDCPVVTPDVVVGGGGGTTHPLTTFYYRGKTGVFVDLGPAPLEADGTHVKQQTLYQLRREGGEPLSEPFRQVDMTGDGDIDDSNDVLAVPRAGAGYSPLCQVVNVAVVAATQSIDTFRDQTRSDVQAESDLFSAPMTPVTSRVVGYQVEPQLINCPQKGS